MFGATGHTSPGKNIIAWEGMKLGRDNRSITIETGNK